MGEKQAVREGSLAPGSRVVEEILNSKTYYCILLSSSEGLFSLRGAAPPPSRKFTEVPVSPPVLVEARPPLKYGKRSTAVPLYSPAARIPATVTPTLGVVSFES